MKLLRSLLLGLSALAQVGFAFLVLMPVPWPGWSQAEVRALLTGVALAAWLPLLITTVGAVSSQVPRGPERVRMLALTGATAALIGVCMWISLIGSVAVAGVSQPGFFDRLDDILVVPPRIGGLLVPLILIAWLWWLGNAADAAEPRRLSRRVIIAALALTLPTGIIGALALGFSYIREAEHRAEWSAEEQKTEADHAAVFARLTDADALDRWAAWALSDQSVDQKERRPAALRRLASRPTLEADIATDLAGPDRVNSDMAFLLVERVQFAPGAALEAPLRRASARIAAEIRHRGPETGSEGDAAEYSIRYEFGDRLAASLAIASRMAEAGVDLRDALHDLQSAALAAYPKSRTAQNYQRDVAAADRKIEAILSARQKTN